VIVNCSHCGKKLAELDGEIKVAQGTVLCPYCGEPFGWSLSGNTIRYIRNGGGA